MYDVTLTIGSNSLILTPTYGYYVSTIDGLTGLQASFKADNNMLLAGENVRSTTIGGRTLQVRGYVLDGHTAAGLLAKDKMLEYIQAGVEGTLVIRRTSRVTSALPVQARVIVKASPTITQERHSRFAFSLYMPFPYYEDYTITTLLMYMGQTTVMALSGSSEVTYELSAKAAGAKIYTATLRTATNLEMRIDFTKSSTGYLPVGSTFTLKRINDGELVLYVTSATIGTIETQCIDLSSDLWLLPRGNYGIELTVTGATGATYTDSTLKYRKTYENIMVT